MDAMSLVPVQGRSQVQLPFTLLCNRFSNDQLPGFIAGPRPTSSLPHTVVMTSRMF